MFLSKNFKILTKIPCSPKLANVRTYTLHNINYKILEHEKQKLCTIFQNRAFSNVITEDKIVQNDTINIGIFKTISESAPVQFFQNSLVDFHTYTNLPWWGTIIGSTILLRSFITLPLAIYQQIIIAKLELLKYEMNDIVKELKKETSICVKLYKWDEKVARSIYNKSVKTQWNKLIIRDNCHPFKTTLLMWVQIPLWVSLSMGIRNLIYMLPKQNLEAFEIFKQLNVEGIGWISNLATIDPYFILPVTFGLINLSLIEIMVLSKVTVPTKLQRTMTHVFRGFTIILVPICSTVPSGILLYWTTSSIFGLVQNITLMSPKIRRFCRIPATPSELENPYKQLQAALKTKLRLTQKNIDS